MKSLVSVYTTHDDAVKAVENLKNAGYTDKQVSIVSKADLVNNHIHVKSGNNIEKAEMSLGVAAGGVIGVLSGIGVFAIPGLGFLFGAGALVGLIAGLDFGIMGAGIVAILTNIGIDQANARKYEAHLNQGRFLVFVQGNNDQVQQAEKALHEQNLHLELSTH